LLEHKSVCIALNRKFFTKLRSVTCQTGRYTQFTYPKGWKAKLILVLDMCQDGLPIPRQSLI